MLDYPEEDLVITERAAIVAWELARGKTLTTEAVAEMVGICYHSAYRMLCKIARVTPVVDEFGSWKAIPLED